VEGLLTLVMAFPTVVFATLALVCLAYWGLVLLGVADLDVGGGGEHAALSSVEGVVGAAKAFAPGLAGGTVAAALAAVGLSRVPWTVTLTAFALAGFFGSAVTRIGLEPYLPGAVTAALALLAGGAAGLGAASVAARALRRLFVDGAVEQGGDSLVGRACRITIATDDGGGQARVDEVIVAVRAVAQRLEPGAEAVIVERGDDGVFVVEPLAVHLPDEATVFARLQAAADAAVAPTHPDALAARVPHKEPKS